MRRAGQAPERGQSGQFINRQSTPGKKLITSRLTNFASTSGFMNDNNEATTISVNVTIWPENLATGKRTSSNILDWESVLVEVYADFYIGETDGTSHLFDDEYLWPSGNKLQAAFLGALDDLIITSVDTITTNTGASHNTIFHIFNNSANAYFFDLVIGAKYIILSEEQA